MLTNTDTQAAVIRAEHALLVARAERRAQHAPFQLARPPRQRARMTAVAFCVAVGLTLALLAALGSELALAYRTPPSVPADWHVTANRELVTRWYAALWTTGAMTASERFVATDHTYHDRLLPDVPSGPEGMVTVAATLRRALPDLQGTLDEVVAGQTSVTVRLTLRGTHLGPLMGTEGTGKHVEVTVLALHHIDDGRITDTWVSWDSVGLAQQLGLTLVSPIVLAGVDGWDLAPAPNPDGGPS